jgi:hypothetical protein
MLLQLSSLILHYTNIFEEFFLPKDKVILIGLIQTFLVDGLLCSVLADDEAFENFLGAGKSFNVCC